MGTNLRSLTHTKRELLLCSSLFVFVLVSAIAKLIHPKELGDVTAKADRPCTAQRILSKSF